MAEQGRGYITVNVRTAGGALPVEGALVTVSSSDNGTVVAVTVTDHAGLGEIIELPTPPKSNSRTAKRVLASRCAFSREC